MNLLVQDLPPALLDSLQAVKLLSAKWVFFSFASKMCYFGENTLKWGGGTYIWDNIDCYRRSLYNKSLKCKTYKGQTGNTKKRGPGMRH